MQIYNADLKKVWDVRIAGFKTSGQSISKWFVDHKLNKHQLRYWLRKSDSKETRLITSNHCLHTHTSLLVEAGVRGVFTLNHR